MSVHIKVSELSDQPKSKFLLIIKHSSRFEQKYSQNYLLKEENHQLISKIFHHLKWFIEIKMLILLFNFSITNKITLCLRIMKQNINKNTGDECRVVNVMALTTRSISRTILLYLHRRTPKMMNGMSRASSQSVFFLSFPLIIINLPLRPWTADGVVFLYTFFKFRDLRLIFC